MFYRPFWAMGETRWGLGGGFLGVAKKRWPFLATPEYLHPSICTTPLLPVAEVAATRRGRGGGITIGGGQNGGRF